MLTLALSLALLATASPSPAPAKSAAAPVFVGPSGWNHVKGTSDGLGTWLRPGDTGYSENVVVERKDGFPSLDALLTAEVNYIASLPDQFGYAPVDTTVCGNHPAKYLSYTYTSSTGVPVTSEVVIAVFGTTAYSANYSKTITQWADPAAESSLKTICGREKSP